MSLNPIIALDHVIEEYRDHLQSEFRAPRLALRGALEGELDRPLFLVPVSFYQLTVPSARPVLEPASTRPRARLRRGRALQQQDRLPPPVGSH